MKRLLASVSAFALAVNLAQAASKPVILGLPGGGSGANNANQAIANLHNMPTSLGAKCDANNTGAGTDDTAAFNASIAATSVIMLPPQLDCLVTDLVITDGQTLDCQGSIIQAAPNAHWIIKKTGFNSHIRNCVTFDPNWTTMKTSTLAAPVAPGVNVIPLADASKMQVNMIASVQLASGAYWVSKITAVNLVSNTITIADPIPYTLTGVSVNTGGTNYVSTAPSGGNPNLIIDEGIILGGDGLPATVSLTTSGGGITAAAIDSPGLWVTSPGSVAAVFDPRAPFAFNGALNLTLAGAAGGGFVDASFGSMIDDNGTDGSIENVTISDAGVGLEILASNGNASSSESIRLVNVNNALIAGMAKLVNVANSSFREIRVNGYIHHASVYGAVGIYLDATGITRASGGNVYDVVTLGFEMGLLAINSTIDNIEHGIFDTSRNAAVACFGCNGIGFDYLWASFTGRQASSRAASTGGQGIGAFFGSSTTIHPTANSISHLVTSANASDVHLGNPLAQLWLDNLTWSWTKFATGYLAQIEPGFKLVNIPTSADTVGMSGTIYLAPGQLSTTQNVSTISGTFGEITSLGVNSTVAPGAATYTAFYYVNHWNGTSFDGWKAGGKCTWTGTALGCNTSQSGTPILFQDQIDISVTIDTGSFPSGQKFNAYINGV